VRAQAVWLPLRFGETVRVLIRSQGQRLLVPGEIRLESHVGVGKVDSEGSTQWTIGGNVVQVTADTKIVGNPQVGDEVEVVEKVQILPPGSMAPTMLPVAISITKIVLTPPPTPGRTVEFDGVVQSLPPAASPSSVPLGHWTISGKDVLVTAMTKVDPGIVQGSSVHVVGLTLPISILAPSATPQIVALQITKL